MSMLRRTLDVDGWPWVVVAAGRTRITLKRADSTLHAKRLSLGMTQATMAAHLGITQPTLCKYESGAIHVPADLFRKLELLK